MAFTHNTQEAAALWGSEAFDAIPKAAFATVAWHLANAYSGEADRSGAAAEAFVKEARTLNYAGILSDRHFALIERAIAKGK